MAEVAREFLEAFEKDPEKAIKEIHNYIEKSDDNNAFIKAVVKPDNTMMIRAIGSVYSSLDRELREIVLWKVLYTLDRFDYINAQNHVMMIDDPWLVSDILINRPLYWCGYKRYVELLEEKQTWTDFKPEVEKAYSKFWAAYSIIHEGYASEAVRQGFYEEFPELVDKTLDMIAARNCEEGADLRRYDQRFTERIKEKIAEEKWVKINF